MLKRFHIIAIVFLFSNNAFAYFYSGNDLREALREYRNAEQSARDTDYAKAWNFRGFVVGVYDATASMYCTKTELTSHQLMAVVAKYIEAHPELWGEPAYKLVVESLQTAFPCGR